MTYVVSANDVAESVNDLCLTILYYYHVSHKQLESPQIPDRTITRRHRMAAPYT